MCKMLAQLCIAVSVLGSAEQLVAQVTASQPQATAPPAQEICPLQLDYDLSREGLKRSFAEVPAGSTFSVSTSRFTCDRAKIGSITVSKPIERAREVQVVASVRLTTEWIRQVVNLRIQLLVNGQVKRSEEFLSMSVGKTDGGAAYLPVGTARVREGKWWIKRSDFDAWFGDGSKPSVRVILEIVP